MQGRKKNLKKYNFPHTVYSMQYCWMLDGSMCYEMDLNVIGRTTSDYTRIHVFKMKNIVDLESRF